MTKKKKTILILTIAAAILLPLLIWTIWGNTALQLTEYTVQNPEVPSAFDGFRIAHISDLHNTEIGDHNEKLLAMLRCAQPDIIAITGDLVDFRRTDIAIALEFAGEAVKIAPCYYVAGNHETRVGDAYAQLKTDLLALGVVVLENERVTLERSGETISLLGIQDPEFEADHWRIFPDDVMDKNLAALSQEDGFQLLLSHRPEYMDMYVRYGIDLALCGHAHGGQFRLPFVGGLFAPGQGFFPEYDAGLFAEGDTQMIVSRGIGNSAFPLRFNNRPEVVLITLTE